MTHWDAKGWQHWANVIVESGEVIKLHCRGLFHRRELSHHGFVVEDSNGIVQIKMVVADRVGGGLRLAPE